MRIQRMRECIHESLEHIVASDLVHAFEEILVALVHTLDPHSSYLSPRNSEEYRIQMSLSYFGIGASLQIDADNVKIGTAQLCIATAGY